MFFAGRAVRVWCQLNASRQRLRTIPHGITVLLVEMISFWSAGEKGGKNEFLCRRRCNDANTTHIASRDCSDFYTITCCIRSVLGGEQITQI